MQNGLPTMNGPSPVYIYRAEKDPHVLLANISTICTLADREKEALAFLTPAAYIGAIEKRRLVGMLATLEGRSDLVGFILFSGVYPNARIQQVVVEGSHRRAHVASALLNEVVSQLEERVTLRCPRQSLQTFLPLKHFMSTMDLWPNAPIRGGGRAIGKSSYALASFKRQVCSPY